MTCESGEQLIVQALDGALTTRERAALDAHLQTCPACRDAQMEYSVLAATANAWAREPQDSELSDAFTDQVWARVVSRQDPGVSRRQFGWTLASALIAAGACITLGAILPPLPVPTPDMSQTLTLTSTAHASLDISPWLTESAAALSTSFDAVMNTAAHGYALPAWVPRMLAAITCLNIVLFACVRRQAAS